MDLIDIEQALKAIKNELAYQEKHATPGEDIDTGIICGLRQAAEIVKGIEPSAEKAGMWENYLDEAGMLGCSCCGALSAKRWNYCPNCGARMEG